MEFIIRVSDDVQPDGSQIIEESRELVRCVDCKRYPNCCRIPRNDPGWFCADGERLLIGEKKHDSLQTTPGGIDGEE